MSLAPDQLPNDIAELKRLVISKDAELAAAKNGLMIYALQIEKLKVQIARLKRQAYGASSERIEREIVQLELQLEELEAAQAQASAVTPPAADGEQQQTEAREKKPRRKLPAELPRTEIVHTPSPPCDCNSEQRKVGEDVTEILEYVPGRFEVVRHVRPATSCRICGAMAQAPMPALPIPRGFAGPGFLAHMLMGKYGDHLPLYRQAEIYARDGVELDRATLADWVGRMAWLVRPLAEKIAEHVMAGTVIDRKSTRLNSSHIQKSRMPSSA